MPTFLCPWCGEQEGESEMTQSEQEICTNIRWGYGVYSDDNRCLAFFLLEKDALAWSAIQSSEIRYRLHPLTPVRRTRGLVIAE